MRTPTCARRGCPKPLPAIAVREQDPFCSAACARTHHGVAERTIKGGQPPRDVCGGCGCDLDQQMAGCEACGQRHRARNRKRAAA